MALPNPGMDFTAFDTLTAAELDDLVENIESLEDGSGFDLGNNVIPANALATTAITLGYAQITSGFTASSVAVQDVTGITSTVTVPAGGRRVVVLCYLPQIYSSVDGNRLDFSIQEDGVNIQETYTRVFSAANGGNGGYIVRASKVASAGSHTYKLRVATGVGAGVATIFAAAGGPASITVEAR